MQLVSDFSPAFLIFGRHIPFSGRYYGKVTSTANLELCPGVRNTYVEDVTNLTEIFAQVRQRIDAAY